MRDDRGGVLWAFRVASRPEAGGGHVARCLVLARALCDLGDRVLFVLDDDGFGWRSQIVEHGHGCVSASGVLAERMQGCLIDGYDFDEQAIGPWRERALLVVAIVDHQPRPEWADLVIATGMPSDSERADSPTPRILAGLDYALVDRRFVQSGPRAVSRTVRHVLVSFGHRDSQNATGLALGALELLPGVRKGEISITVAIGSSGPHLADVKARVAQFARATCEADADMVKCYAAADFVIGSGGVGLLQRMAQGIPSASVILADNQRQQIGLCAAAGGTLSVGRFEDLDLARMTEVTFPLIDSYERRCVMSASARHAVDGLGAKRCAQAMWDAFRVH